MKPGDFETIMRKKYENRTQSKNYVEEANEDLVFVKYFTQYIKKEQAFTDKVNLLEYRRPHFDMTKKSLEFLDLQICLIFFANNSGLSCFVFF